MGFCVYNHIALAARHARKQHGIERTLILDWDVHHGNGTQDIFYADPAVFYCSTHQSPLYPYTGSISETGWGSAVGTTLNLPMLAGASGTEVIQALEKKLLPAMENFQPELVLISAGFDARIEDPIGGLAVTDDDFQELTRTVIGIARQYAGGRIVSVLEGGYNLFGLASACTAHVQVLVDEG